jgi:hypothetical protein
VVPRAIGSVATLTSREHRRPSPRPPHHVTEAGPIGRKRIPTAGTLTEDAGSQVSIGSGNLQDQQRRLVPPKIDRRQVSY